MATVNIGSLKFNWKGAYNGSTAYAIDDVTEYNGSSYICILASTGNLPTNTTYFQPMATKGTDGTDVGTTLTTQGDILYRDGSGLQRLAAGTNGQVLLTGGSGANPSWGTISSDFVKTGYTETTVDASSFDVQNCFTSDYDIYKVVFHARTDTTTNPRWRYYTGTNTERSGNTYMEAHTLTTSNSGTNTTGSAVGWGESSYFPRENIDGNAVHSGNWQMTIYNPYDSAVKTYVTWNFAAFDGSYLRTVVGGGFFDNAESNTGLKFFVSAGNFRAGAQVGVYGLKK